MSDEQPDGPLRRLADRWFPPEGSVRRLVQSGLRPDGLLRRLAQRRLRQEEAIGAAVLAALIVGLMTHLAWAAISGGPPAPSPTVAASHPPSPTPSPKQQPKGPVTTGFAPSGIAFWNPTHGLVVGTTSCRSCKVAHEGVLASTTDGGKTWRIVYRSPHALTGVTTLGSREAWATGANLVIHSTNAGSSWRAVAHQTLAHPTFVTSSLGWAVAGTASKSGIVETVDGGRRWGHLSDPCHQKLNGLTGADAGASVFSLVDVSLLGAGHGFAYCVGDGAGGSAPQGLFETFDDGVTWFQRWADVTVEPGGISILADGHGWRWGASDRLTATADGGRTWHPLQPGAPSNVDFAWATSPSAGYVLTAGPDPQLVHTSNGTAWKVVAHFPS
jgi:photosystem II stability/assembly factor-like uncharacterized protein